MTVSVPPLTPPGGTTSLTGASTEPTPEALAVAVRQHGALGARLLADYWRRGNVADRTVRAVADAVPALRATSVRDVALARREPPPFPAGVSGGPLDDMFSDPTALSNDPQALQRAAHESRSFGQCLGAEIVTHGCTGLDAIDSAVTQFAARHVDELVRMGDSASEAVADLARILAGDPGTLAERQRQVIMRLLAPREGERFHGMTPGIRAALALAVLADESTAADRTAGASGLAIAGLVGAAASAGALIGAVDSVGRVAGQEERRGAAGSEADAGTERSDSDAVADPDQEEPRPDRDVGGHSL